MGALLALVSLAPSGSAAQSRFGLGIDLGVALPLNASIQNAARLQSSLDDADAQFGIPELLNRHNGVGFRLSLYAMLSTLEVRYRYQRLAFRFNRVSCVGDRLAERLPNGELADADVRYLCEGQARRESVASGTTSPLQLHHLSVGPRFYWRGRSSVSRDATPTRLYAIVAAGPSIVIRDDDTGGAAVRPGGHLSVGGGLEVALERALFLTVDTRYTFTLFGGTASASERANRAIATGRNVLTALTDIFHQVELSVGLRIDFR
jgi:hypothetical protein